METKTSITSTSTTVTHSLRVDRVEAGNDEILIDATTSLDGICLPKSEGEQSYSVESIDGDIMVTTITSQQSSINATDLIKFIARRVNDIDLLVNGVTIGKREIIILFRKYFDTNDIIVNLLFFDCSKRGESCASFRSNES